MNQERMKILQMLQDGKLSLEDAAHLLEALQQPAPVVSFSDQDRPIETYEPAIQKIEAAALTRPSIWARTLMAPNLAAPTLPEPVFSSPILATPISATPIWKMCGSRPPI